MPGAADREAFDNMTSVPDPMSHPNTFGWYMIVSKFSPEIRASWSGGAAAAPGGQKQDAG